MGENSRHGYGVHKSRCTVVKHQNLTHSSGTRLPGRIRHFETVQEHDWAPRAVILAFSRLQAINPNLTQPCTAPIDFASGCLLWCCAAHAVLLGHCDFHIS